MKAWRLQGKLTPQITTKHTPQELPSSQTTMPIPGGAWSSQGLGGGRCAYRKASWTAGSERLGQSNFNEYTIAPRMSATNIRLMLPLQKTTMLMPLLVSRSLSLSLPLSLSLSPLSLSLSLSRLEAKSESKSRPPVSSPVQFLVPMTMP